MRLTRYLTELEKKYMQILKEEKGSARQGESDIHLIIDDKYSEIKHELENYNRTQKQNFKGLESIIEVGRAVTEGADSDGQAQDRERDQEPR